MALNAKLKIVMTLNAKTENSDDSNHRNRECDSDDGSERQNWEVITMALNAERRCEWWLWEPKQDDRDGSGNLNEMAEMALEA